MPESTLWIPSPLKPSAVVIKFFKTRADVKEIEFKSPYEIYLLNTIRLASGDNLTIVYYYTASLNKAIDEAFAHLRNYAKSFPPTDKRVKFTSGFVNICDAANNQYRIDYWLDDLNT